MQFHLGDILSITTGKLVSPSKMEGAAFLHASGVPLADADLRTRAEVLDEDYGAAQLFTDEDMDCDAGVCFT